MSALSILFSIISTAAMIAVLHYVLTSAFWPEQFLARTHARQVSVKNGIYFSLALLGGAIILFGGFRTALFWLASSFGMHDSDGNFNPLRDSVSGILATLVFPFFSFLDSAAINKVAVQKEKAETKRPAA